MDKPATFFERDWRYYKQIGFDYADPCARCAYNNLDDALDGFHGSSVAYMKLSEGDKLEADEAFEAGFELRTVQGISTLEAAKYVGCSKITIKRAKKSGALVPEYTRKQGAVTVDFYTRAALDKWNASRKNPKED